MLANRVADNPAREIGSGGERDPGDEAEYIAKGEHGRLTRQRLAEQSGSLRGLLRREPLCSARR